MLLLLSAQLREAVRRFREARAESQALESAPPSPRS